MKSIYFLQVPEDARPCIADIYSDSREFLPYKGMVLSRINVPAPARGKGYARQLMQEILRDADTEGVTLHLEINASDGLTYGQLQAWYERLGFKFNKYGWMTRRPKLQEG